MSFRRGRAALSAMMHAAGPAWPSKRRCRLVSARLAWLFALCAFVPALPLRADVVVPNFWDVQARIKKPDLAGLRVVRFLTDDEYPPLTFTDADGLPTGFSVDLARAACDVLQIACTIQVRRFDTLLDSLAQSRGDAIAAAVPVTAALRQRFSVTTPYHRMPARFAAKVEASLPDPSPEALADRSVGVVVGSAHEAYLRAFFPRVVLRLYPNLPAAEDGLKSGEVNYLFADGLGLALWLNGRDAGRCCVLRGGPYTENRFFGEGVGFVVRREDETLRRALDYALQKLWEDGTYTELFLRYFPVSFY